MPARPTFAAVIVLALAAACASDAADAGTPAVEVPSSQTPAPRPTLPSTVAAGEAGDQLAVPGYQPLILANRTVDLGAIVFDTFNGGSVPLDRATPSMIARLSDAIPPLHTPDYGDASDGDWLDPTDLVLGYVAADGAAYAYPHKILNFHEIVNDELGGDPVVITYCPLCRSGVVYDRRLDGRTLTFGNTSALYLSDMVMYDEETYSYWWQVPGESIVGALAGERLQPLGSQTMEWRTWLALHPDTRVLSRATGYPRNYERDPFTRLGESLDEGARPFQSNPGQTDGRLRPSDLVLGIEVDGEHAVYSLTAIGDGVRNDVIFGRPIVVFGSADGPAGGAFFADPEAYDSDRLTFDFADGAWHDLETDSTWDLGGRAVSGSLVGTRLEAAPVRTTFWYAYIAAFPEAELRD